jgi:hypothetical protein
MRPEVVRHDYIARPEGGASTYSTYARNTAASVAPSTVMTASNPWHDSARSIVTSRPKFVGTAANLLVSPRLSGLIAQFMEIFPICFVTYQGHLLPDIDTMIAAADARMYAVKKQRLHGTEASTV